MQKQAAIVVSLLAGMSLVEAQSPQQEFKLAGERMDQKTVTGLPYSAKAVTTSTQTLADGTKITRTIQALLARDSDGRTRREQELNSVGPWSTNSSDHLVYIKDPVAQAQYVLKPGSQVAIKVGLARYLTETEISKKIADAKKKEAEREAASREGSRIILGEPESKAQVEDLGERMLESVKAKGRRETQNIPVGAVGNDRPLRIVSEVWYSDDLQTIVLSKHSDPRVGDSEYRLTEISRVEPPRSSFEVPAGYSIREEGKRP